MADTTTDNHYRRRFLMGSTTHRIGLVVALALGRVGLGGSGLR